MSEPTGVDCDPTSDGGTSKTDGGTSKTDGGTSKTDGGTSKTDGGTSKTDGGTSKTDGGTSKTDGGTPNTDGGTPNTDGGTPNTDGGTPNTDGGTPNTDGGNPNTDGGNPTNQPHRFDRLPETASERVVEGRATREAVTDFLVDSYGIPASTFEDHTFWERGAGKIWLFHGDLSTPVHVEGLGMAALRTRQEHWKPTLEFAQRFGDAATRNVVHLEEGAAAAFLAGHDQEREWDGDWGYVLVSHDLADAPEPIGVGLYLHGELRSQVPKGRRRDFLE